MAQLSEQNNKRNLLPSNQLCSICLAQGCVIPNDMHLCVDGFTSITSSTFPKLPKFLMQQFNSSVWSEYKAARNNWILNIIMCPQEQELTLEGLSMSLVLLTAVKSCHVCFWKEICVAGIVFNNRQPRGCTLFSRTVEIHLTMPCPTLEWVQTPEFQETISL